jgi:hypothetical protein
VAIKIGQAGSGSVIIGIWIRNSGLQIRGSGPGEIISDTQQCFFLLSKSMHFSCLFVIIARYFIFFACTVCFVVLLDTIFLLLVCFVYACVVFCILLFLLVSYCSCKTVATTAPGAGPVQEGGRELQSGLYQGQRETRIFILGTLLW